MKSIFQKCVLLLSVSLICACLISCGASSSTEEDLSSQTQEKAPASQTPEEDRRLLLSEKARMLCGSYFLKGEAALRMQISPGNADDPNMLSVSLEDALTEAYQTFSLSCTDDTDCWALISPEAANAKNALCLAAADRDASSLILKEVSSDGSDGDVYFSTDAFVMPDAFTRPLNSADLFFLDKEQLSLIRNQFYAAHGRIFASEKLKSHFESQPWYEGRYAPDNFPEEHLNTLEKRNIRFLKQAEEAFDPQVYEQNLKAWQELPKAPYLPILSDMQKTDRMEIQVSIPCFAASVRDMGIYYQAEGEIALPVTLDRNDYLALTAGQELSVKTDELTGETITLKCTGKAGDDTPCFVFLRDGFEEEIQLRYHADTDSYTLWFASDDTIFCTVYKGPVYVLKGACEEYYFHFFQYEASEEESPHLYREMDFTDTAAEDPEPLGDCYFGNRPVFDEKGYLKALYYFGD